MKGRAFCLAFVTISLITFSTIVFCRNLSVARWCFSTPSLAPRPDGGSHQETDGLAPEQKDDWRWLTWSMSATKRPLCRGTFGHAWQDYDQRRVSPWVEEVFQGALASLSVTPVVIQYFDHLEEVSALGRRRKPQYGRDRRLPGSVGKTAQFYEAIRQFHHAFGRLGRHSAMSV